MAKLRPDRELVEERVMAIHTPNEGAARSTMPEPDDHLARLFKDALRAVARIVT